MVLRSPERNIVKCDVQLQFPTTSNEAEYEAILIGLNLAKAIGASAVVLHSNSQVVIGHMNGDYEPRANE